MISKKQSLDEMWKFIDKIMLPNKLVPNKSILTYEQVFSIYSKLYQIEEMFKEVAQMNILKKERSKQK